MVPCRLCQSQHPQHLFSKYKYTISKCLSCGFVYTDFRPTPKFLREFYSQNYFQSGEQKRGYQDYAGEQDALKTTFKKRFTDLHLSSKGKVVDIGCAYGFFLQVIPNSWKKFGVEVSRHAVAVAKANNATSTIIHSSLKSKLLGAASFDLVTLWDVIEHLDDPQQTVNYAYSLLKKGGTIALTTGDVNSLFAKIQGVGWHLFNPPQHLGYFSPTTITSLLQNAGFKQIEVAHPASFYPLSYLLYKLNNLYGFRLPIPRFASKLILPVNLGDIMLVTALR